MTEPGKLLPGLGFDLATWNANTLVHDVPGGSAGDRAGLRAGDRLLAVDGQPVANRMEFIGLVSGAPGRDISIEVERGGERLRMVAAVPRVMEQGRPIGRLGITLEEGPQTWPPGLVETHRSGPVDAVAAGVAKTWEMSSLTVQMLWRIVTGQVRQEHQRSDQHRGICRHQRLSRCHRFLGFFGDHQCEPGRPQFDAGAVVGRRAGGLSAGGSGQGDAAVRARPAVRAAGRDCTACRVDEPRFL